jgi:hypothetical protein
MNFISKTRKNGISNNETALIFDVFQPHWLKQPKGFLIKKRGINLMKMFILPSFIIQIQIHAK